MKTVDKYQLIYKKTVFGISLRVFKSKVWDQHVILIKYFINYCKFNETQLCLYFS